jgi:outer membrane protein OmpA-like peptidoglycan-associated protein
MKGQIFIPFFLFLAVSCAVNPTDEPQHTTVIPEVIPPSVTIETPGKDTVISSAVSGADMMDKQIEELKKELKNADVTRDGDEIKITFNSQILFASNSDQLDPSSEKMLSDLSAVLKKYSGTTIEVGGHTDNIGEEDFNYQLSKKRAAAVARYAAKKGVNPGRFRIKGHGETLPVASNKTEEGRSMNRRVEIAIKGDDFGNNSLARAVDKIKDSTCYCTYDEYKNYICKRLCDSWVKLPASALSFDTTIFKEPACLDELFASTTRSSGEKLYQLGSSDHVVRQNLGAKLEESNAVILVGKVLDKGIKEPTGAKIKVTLMDTGEEVAVLDADPVTGGYSVLLERGKHYSVSVEENGYFTTHDNISIPEMQGYTVIHQDMEVYPLKQGQKMNLNHVFFKQSRAVLLESSFAQLDEVVKLMMNNPTLEIELHGHTDGIGDPQSNFKLSEKRVETIKDYFVSRGVPAGRIHTKAFGGTRPIASNDTEETRKLNRRVEFLIVKF